MSICYQIVASLWDISLQNEINKFADERCVAFILRCARRVSRKSLKTLSQMKIEDVRVLLI